MSDTTARLIGLAICVVSALFVMVSAMMVKSCMGW